MIQKGLYAALLLLALGVPRTWASAQQVTEIRVRGTQRVEPDLVLQRVKSRTGEPYSAAQVREDIRSVYSLGYFRDVTVEMDEQGRLTFVVTERPALREWKTEGAQAVEADEIEKALPIKKREILHEGKVEEGSRAIRDLYREKGYYLADVRSEIVPVAEGKNQADVVYRISEGDKVKVRDFHVLGTRAADEKDIRKRVITSEAGIWSWLSGGGTFKESDLETDREIIRSYYLNRGHAEVKVHDPLVSLTPDRKWLKIDVPVEEGLSYRVGKVRFSGDLEFGEDKLREAAKLVEGETFRSDDFRRALQAVSDLYGDIGYAFVEVDPATALDREKRTVSVDFRIRKGDQIRIGRIEARGNVKTRDRIIRREMRVAEGDLYNGSAIRKSRQKIENLGFFEKVNLTTNRRPGTNLVDVDVEVEEKPTGAFSVGAGYSSVDRIVGMASVSQRNFLGYGYQLQLNANLGSTRETYALTFNNPRVFDSDVYAGVEFYKSDRSYTDYDKDSVGGAAKLGRSLGEDWRIRGIYRWEDADVRNVSDDAPSRIKEEQGKTITSALSGILTYDTRDNPWEPHRGSLAEGSAQWAGGLLGGTAAYLKYDLEGSKYFPLWWRHVLTAHGQLGFIQALEKDGIPIFELYLLGGINSIRGFDSWSVGPEDEKGDVIGGDKMALFNLEYLFPLIEEAKVRGVLFFDAGNSWAEGEPYFASELRTGVGGGVRWFSPLGPLRLEYGYNLKPKEGEARARWEFSIGGFF